MDSNLNKFYYKMYNYERYTYHDCQKIWCRDKDIKYILLDKENAIILSIEKHFVKSEKEKVLQATKNLCS